MLTYILEVSLCWSIFYAIFYSLLRKVTFYRVNRWYLLVSLLLGIVIPLLRFIEIDLYQEDIAEIAPLAYVIKQAPAQIAVSVIEQTRDWNSIIQTVLLSLYLLGLGMFFFRFFKGLYTIRKLYISGDKTVHATYTLIQTNEHHLPFSFLNNVFISNAIELKEDVQDILKHELAHVNSKHSLDVLLIELINIVFWFNPLVYLFKTAIRQTHEYLADAVVLQDTPRQLYGKILLKQSLSGIQVALAHHFFHSHLKKRINMMYQKKSGQSAWLKYSLTLPVLLVLFIVFSGYGEKPYTTEDLKQDMNELIYPGTDNPYNDFATIEGFQRVLNDYDLSKNFAIAIDGVLIEKDITKYIKPNVPFSWTGSVRMPKQAIPLFGPKAQYGILEIYDLVQDENLQRLKKSVRPIDESALEGKKAKSHLSQTTEMQRLYKMNADPTYRIHKDFYENLPPSRGIYKNYLTVIFTNQDFIKKYNRNFTGDSEIDMTEIEFPDIRSIADKNPSSELPIIYVDDIITTKPLNEYVDLKDGHFETFDWVPAKVATKLYDARANKGVILIKSKNFNSLGSYSSKQIESKNSTSRPPLVLYEGKIKAFESLEDENRHSQFYNSLEIKSFDLVNQYGSIADGYTNVFNYFNSDKGYVLRTNTEELVIFRDQKLDWQIEYTSDYIGDVTFVLKDGAFNEITRNSINKTKSTVTLPLSSIQSTNENFQISVMEDGYIPLESKIIPNNYLSANQDNLRNDQLVLKNHNSNQEFIVQAVELNLRKDFINNKVDLYDQLETETSKHKLDRTDYYYYISHYDDKAILSPKISEGGIFSFDRNNNSLNLNSTIVEVIYLPKSFSSETNMNYYSSLSNRENSFIKKDNNILSQSGPLLILFEGKHIPMSPIESSKKQRAYNGTELFFSRHTIEAFAKNGPRPYLERTSEFSSYFDNNEFQTVINHYKSDAMEEVHTDNYHIRLEQIEKGKWTINYQSDKKETVEFIISQSAEVKKTIKTIHKKAGDNFVLELEANDLPKKGFVLSIYPKWLGGGFDSHVYRMNNNQLVSDQIAIDQWRGNNQDNGNISLSQIVPQSDVEPLMVLNGIALGHGKELLDNTETKDIKYLKVLKGEAALVKYGDKGINGVVEVYTDEALYEKSKSAKDRIEIIEDTDQSEGLMQKGKPLFVLDGIVKGKEHIKQINPQDIEDIKVLKGEAAIDKYGDRAIDGVVEVNLKNSQATTRISTEDKSKTSKKEEAFSTIAIADEKGNDVTGSAKQIMISRNNETQATDVAKTDPLIVLDGEVTILTSTDHLDPDKIATVNVFKGNAAIDKYGVKAKDGVIEVYTKEFVKNTDSKNKHEPIGISIDDSNSTIQISNNDKQPLFVIDDEVLKLASGDVLDLDPDKIATVNVIKGDSALNEYGEAGKDGVLIIYTKKYINENKKSDISVTFDPKTKKQVISFTKDDAKTPIEVEEGELDTLLIFNPETFEETMKVEDHLNNLSITGRVLDIGSCMIEFESKVEGDIRVSLFNLSGQLIDKRNAKHEGQISQHHFQLQNNFTEILIATVEQKGKVISTQILMPK